MLSGPFFPSNSVHPGPSKYYPLSSCLFWIVGGILSHCSKKPLLVISWSESKDQASLGPFPRVLI